MYSTPATFLPQQVGFWQDSTAGYDPGTDGYSPLVIMKLGGSDAERKELSDAISEAVLKVFSREEIPGLPRRQLTDFCDSGAEASAEASAEAAAAADTGRAGGEGAGAGASRIPR